MNLNHLKLQNNSNNINKDLFRRLSEFPPAEIWRKISDELDIDEVWEGVSNTLKRDAKVLRIKRALRNTVAVIVLLMIAGGVGIFINLTDNGDSITDKNYEISPINSNYNNPYKLLSGVSKTNIKKEQQSPFAEFISNNNDIKAEAKTVQQKQSNTSNLFHNIYKTKINKNQDVYIIEEKSDVAYLVPITVLSVGESKNYDDLITQFFTKERNGLASDFNNEDVTLLPRGLYSGVTFCLNNVWLLNHDTYNGFKESELNYTNITWGKSYGLAAGYNISDKWGAQVDWLIHSEVGQEYTEYNEGRQYVKTIDFAYMVWNFLAKYKWTRMGFKGTTPVSNNFVFGSYLGWLKSANEIKDGDTKDVTTQYADFDYGAHFGYEYEMYLRKRWILSVGIHSNFGFKNIFDGTDIIPSEFNRTENLTLGFYAGMKYLFIKK